MDLQPYGKQKNARRTSLSRTHVPYSLLIFLTLYTSLFAFEEPWGKDSDLHQEIIQHCNSNSCSTPLLGPFAECLIRFHQEVISPADGPRSHYFPSSSQYTLEAIRKHGFFQGWILGCDRLMRENNDPWVYSVICSPEGQILKYNPVP